MHRAIRILFLSIVMASTGVAGDALAAKATECTKIGICYCVNDELKPTIQSKVDRFRQTIADERKAARPSLPERAADVRRRRQLHVNKEVAESAAIESASARVRLCANPGTLDADLPKGAALTTC
jgi:hypothetical protein